MKILVTGSRHWRSRSPILRAILGCKATIVVHGAAPGADSLADDCAKQLGLDVRPYPANWTAHGRAAGPIRNQEMLDKEHRADEPIDLVLAFPAKDSIGTWDMVRRAKKAGIKVIEHEPLGAASDK